MNSRRFCDKAAVGMGAMIMFISTGILACLILATMIQMAEVTAQTPESIMNLATRETADKIIIHEIYVWDEFDNYGIIWELAPGSEPKVGTELFWILQCEDPTGEFWAFWGDFTTASMDIPPHEFSVKTKATPGLKAEFFNNQGMGNTALPKLTNRIPDLITVENDINYGSTAGVWNTDNLGNLPWGDEFSLRASGYIDVPADGTYTFELESDDGSRLWVDGTLVVDHDGLHGFAPLEGKVILEEGRNSINIEYFENTGSAGLVLRWESPDFPKEIVPRASLTHDDNMVDDNNMDDWIAVTTFQPGVVYEISIDQKNGAAGRNNQGMVIPSPTCGPTQLHENGLEGEMTFVVGSGGATWTHFIVPHETAGTRLV